MGRSSRRAAVCRAQWGIAALLLAGGCAEDGAAGGVGPGAAAGPVGPPPAASLDRVDPEIAAQLSELLDAARADPEDGGRRAALGMAYEVAARPDTALTCYRQAQALDPDEPRWAYYRALLEGALGDTEGALETLDSVLELEAGYVPAYLNRGQWLLDLGRHGEARATFQRATVLDGESHAAWIGLARAQLKLGQREQAARILENLATRYEHPQVFQLLGLAYREAGDLDRARAALARGRPGPPPGWPDPWNGEKTRYLTGFGVHLRQAEILLERGHTAAAIEAMEELRVQRPADVALLNNLAVAYGQIGQPDRALEVLLAGLEHRPDYFPFHLNLANRYQRRGEVAKAFWHVERAIELNPTLGFAHQQKALLLEQAGRHREARDAVDRALTLEATNARWFLHAARLEARLGDWRRSLARAEQAAHIDPSSQEIQQWIARCRAELR